MFENKHNIDAIFGFGFIVDEPRRGVSSSIRELLCRKGPLT